MNILLISSSAVHGYGFLDHAEPEMRKILAGRKRVLFVPFALQDHAAYTAKIAARLSAMDFEVQQCNDAGDVELAEAIFIGGGNTFRLLKTLYEREMMDVIRDRVRNGMPYLGSSAGTNVATPSIKTTNDMPIVEPPSFEALGLVPFQINPHYLDPDQMSTHQGETREERILQYLEENTTPVVGLREGTMIRVDEASTTLVGIRPARIFTRGVAPYELEAGSQIAF